MTAGDDASRSSGRRGRSRSRSRSRGGARWQPSEELLARRRAAVPVVTFPPELPVVQRRDEIAAAIRDHQVVVVAGETGSGKTTQIPKICLELGRGVTGTIGHTQPRRLAARTVASRIAEELGVELGTAVGYAVRFTDQVSDTTLVKLMTDGILLNELQRDRDLSAYDTIIVDEAHERSLNIDFILGYLAQLLPRRPDLKVIITSATIDPGRFSAHFGGAPVIEVSGRTYPVEVRWRPLAPARAAASAVAPAPPPPNSGRPPGPGRRSRGPGGGRGATGPGRGRTGGGDPDQVEAIVAAVHELRREPPGDILVFLSGEREIRDTAEALRALDLPGTAILPLYARLSSAEQHRVFEAHAEQRIVLATNVAETSITVPGIRYVIDPGVARISRYSNRLKVQRLPIEPVSQASAAQRAGRCGRVADGICIRLYAEDDFESRPAFTEPEMLRTNLASVILQMTAIGLGDIEAFPFVDPPDRRAVADGVRLLQELGALETGVGDRHHSLTPVGRTMARLPVDPRYARMLVEAERRGCLREVLVLAAGLSIQDVRERPADDAAAADALHARFVDPTSDFSSLLAVWSYVRERQRELGSSAFRRLCRREFLNVARIREWQDVHSQLRRAAGDMGMTIASGPADPEQVHRALLAGLLSHIGLRDGESRDFLGARQTRFSVFPGSGLARRPPAWVMAAELVETSRLFARTAARIDPGWVEELAGHLVKRQVREPHWSSRRAAAMVHESVTLYGLPIVADRLVPYARIDPEHARELFIRHALVEGDWQGRHAFVAANRALLEEVEDLEHRFRRRDLPVDDEALVAAYDQRLPDSIVSGRHFESWWRRERSRRPDLFDLDLDDLVGAVLGELDENAFPATWVQGELELPLSYRYDPGTPDDGVAVHIPITVLNRVRTEGFDRLVPGLRDDLLAGLLRSLPKHLRRGVGPIPDAVVDLRHDEAAALDATDPGSRRPVTDVVAGWVARRVGEPVEAGDVDAARLPDHLRMIFVVEAPDGAVLGQGRDLVALQEALAPTVRRALSEAVGDVEAYGLTAWTIGELPRRVARTVGGHEVVGHPALVDEGATVGVRVFDDPGAQARAMWAGTRRLLVLGLPLASGALQRELSNGQRLALGWSPYAGGVDALLDDLVAAVIDAELRAAGGPVWDAVGFDALRASVGADLPRQVGEGLAVVARVLAADRVLGRRLEATPRTAALAPSLDDMADQRAGLVFDRFVGHVGRDRLGDLERYLHALTLRLDKLTEAPARDRDRMATVARVQAHYAEALDRHPPGSAVDRELERLGWAIEELRVSLFAESVGTAGPVSEARLVRALTALGG